MMFVFALDSGFATEDVDIHDLAVHQMSWLSGMNDYLEVCSPLPEYLKTLQSNHGTYFSFDDDEEGLCSCDSGYSSPTSDDMLGEGVSTPGYIPWLENADKPQAKIYKDIEKRASTVAKEGLCHIEDQEIRYNGAAVHAYPAKALEGSSSRTTLKASMYVMTAKKGLILVPESLKDKPSPDNILNTHSAFLLDQPVTCAGYIRIQAGKIVSIDNKSGHYAPTIKHLHQAIQYLAKEGVLAGDCCVRYKNAEGVEQKDEVKTFLDAGVQDVSASDPDAYQRYHAVHTLLKDGAVIDVDKIDDDFILCVKEKIKKVSRGFRMSTSLSFTEDEDLFLWDMFSGYPVSPGTEVFSNAQQAGWQLDKDLASLVVGVG
ncbi:hypothetical protein [Candidatus Hepatobacter penaei]|uniref:hypothetical protein n=1 Tax=Candidatus Hepatobacter penaei TaxID=1274402 RepID=UPI001093DEC3|nr:hypothetical protein [Candidatus Hepatobacter penaei]TGW15678.1 hypothetical protein EIL50_01010 [bacterium NHP-B]